MAEALLTLFASRGKLVDLLVGLIEHEVAITGECACSSQSRHSAKTEPF